MLSTVKQYLLLLGVIKKSFYFFTELALIILNASITNQSKCSKSKDSGDISFQEQPLYTA